MNRMITDLMSVRGAIRARSVGGVDTRRFELERVDDSSVVLSLDLTDALGLVALIVEQVGAAASPGHVAKPDPHVVAALDAAIVLGQSMPRFVEGSGPWDYSAEEVALGRAVDALLASRHTLRDTPAGGGS